MPFPVDIDSRDQFSLLPLFTKKISANTFHYSIPGKTSLTYLVAEAPEAMDLDEEIQFNAGTPAEYASASAKELPLSFEYKMPFPVDIDSRDQFALLPLFTKKISANTFHYSIPGKTRLTYLVAEATADKELLAGKLNVYFGGRFIGDTYLSEKKPGEPFSMNLGADRDVKIAYTVHAEVNAILNAAKNGSQTDSSTLYVTFPPCVACSTSVIQAGITRVICPDLSTAPARWIESFTKGQNILSEAGVLVSTYLPPNYA